jgi:hypothetical protein
MTQTPKTLMSLRGQQKPRRGEKSEGELKGDQVLHLWGWIIKPIDISCKAKWSKVRRTRETWIEDVNVIYQQKEET